MAGLRFSFKFNFNYPNVYSKDHHHNSKFSKYQRIGIIKMMFPYQNKTMLSINNKKIICKTTIFENVKYLQIKYQLKG